MTKHNIRRRILCCVFCVYLTNICPQDKNTEINDCFENFSLTKEVTVFLVGYIEQKYAKSSKVTALYSRELFCFACFSCSNLMISWNAEILHGTSSLHEIQFARVPHTIHCHYHRKHIATEKQDAKDALRLLLLLMRGRGRSKMWLWFDRRAGCFSFNTLDSLALHYISFPSQFHQMHYYFRTRNTFIFVFTEFAVFEFSFHFYHFITSQSQMCFLWF